jgi:hypothetical protein
MIGHHLKNIFDSVGFTYVLIFSKNDCLKIPRFHHQNFFENARTNLFFGGGPKNFQKK